MNRLNKRISKIGAYLVLIIGLIVATSAVLLGLSMFILMPDVSLQKKTVVASSLILAGVVVFLISFAIFEAILEAIVVGEKLPDDVDKIREI